MLTIPVSVA